MLVLPVWQARVVCQILLRYINLSSIYMTIQKLGIIFQVNKAELLVLVLELRGRLRVSDMGFHVHEYCRWSDL